MGAASPNPVISTRSAVADPSEPRTFPDRKFTMQNTLHLDKSHGKLFGVCSGLANWSNVDATLIRLGFVVTTLLGFGLPVLLYIAIALVAD